MIFLLYTRTSASIIYWQWQLCIAICRLLWTLLWTELANFAQVFAKFIEAYLRPAKYLSGYLFLALGVSFHSNSQPDAKVQN